MNAEMYRIGKLNSGEMFSDNNKDYFCQSFSPCLSVSVVNPLVRNAG
jgi:hypothetical protein